MRRGLAALAALALTTGACSAAPSTTSATPPATATALTVYAAASLTGAFRDLAAAYSSQTPGVTITLSFDASSALRAKIEQGAPADVFASADTSNPKALADQGLAVSPPTVFAGNTLVVIVPASGSKITSPLDLAAPGIHVVAAGDAVPITTYANQLLAKLAAQPGYPADFATRVAANVVSREDNVRAVVSRIELGEGDAAIVYTTDARASSRVRAIEVPSAAGVSATYAGVVVKSSGNQAAAAAFLAWVASPAGQTILARYRFLPPP